MFLLLFAILTCEAHLIFAARGSRTISMFVAVNFFGSVVYSTQSLLRSIRKIGLKIQEIGKEYNTGGQHSARVGGDSEEEDSSGP